MKLKSYDAVISDLKMPRIDGMALLHHVIEHYPDTPVVILTAHGTIGGAVDALKIGAFDYITKPFDQEDIKNSLRKAIRMRELNEAKVHNLSSDETHNGRFGIIGQSPEMQAMFNIIDKVARQPSTVLVTGESGTGKELIAKALHQQSDRKSKPFIRINCAAIPTTLMESELFGYDKGAFTGADQTKPGRFELADGGTLFLDEIGEISLEMQVKLLRALQESEFERVGGIKTIRVNVRIVTATNRDLLAATRNGSFREDLFYRLNVVPIQLPPLRSRTNDIPLLVDHFIEKYNTRLHKQVSHLDDDAMIILQSYGWPGNIRELENVLERTMLFCDGDVILPDDLPPELVENSAEPSPIPSIHLPAGGDTGLKDVVKETTSRIEREYILLALEETKGNVTQAAKRLKISRKSLQNKMKEFNLRGE